MTKAVKTNSKIKKGSKVENSYPLNTPLSGVFDMGGFGGVAPLSQPFEMSNNASYNLLSLQRVMLSYSYVIFGPLRTLIDQPVLDAFRGGFEIKTDEVSPEELEALHKAIKKIKLKQKIIESMRWGRLFGGAGLIINTNQDPSKQFNIDEVTEDSLLDFIVADRWQLAWNGVPESKQASFNYYPGGYDPAETNIQGKKIHRSRVAKVLGSTAPSLVKQRLQGWSMSEIECVIRELNSYFKNNNVVFELMDEAKVDIWKIKGFNSQVLSKMAQGVTAKRIQTATMMKNFLNAITLDSEDDYEQKQVTFTGLSEMLEQIRIGMAAAIRMPMSKIFGLSASGFASGEDDLQNYASIVELQREKAEELMEIVLPVMMMKVWGFVPDDWSVKWQPVRTLNAEQEQNVLNAKFSRLSTLYSQGILNPQEYTQALKDEEILEMETEVSKGAEPMPVMSMVEDAPEEIGGAKKPSQGKEGKQ